MASAHFPKILVQTVQESRAQGLSRVKGLGNEEWVILNPTP